MGSGGVATFGRLMGECNEVASVTMVLPVPMGRTERFRLCTGCAAEIRTEQARGAREAALKGARLPRGTVRVKL